MITFSVIVPHHDIPQLLQRCLDTIPDVPDIQVIVVDDNSSSDVVDFSHFPGSDRKYTTVVLDHSGLGAGHARNIGLQHAEGRWFVFADSDDFFTPEAFDIMNQYKDDSSDIILFKADSVDSNDYTPSTRHLQLNSAIDDALCGAISNKKAVLSVPSPWCKMFRRNHIQEHGILFDETYASNDQMFVLKATCWAGDAAVKVTPHVVYTVTTRSGSLDANKKKSPRNYLSTLDVLIRCNQFCDRYGMDDAYDRRPIIVQVFRGWSISFGTFCRAFILAVRGRALFSGMSVIVKKLKVRSQKR